MRSLQRWMPRAATLILTMACAVTAFGQGPGHKSYTFEPIDNPDAGPLGTSVFGINAPGVMVGNFSDIDDVIGGFVLRAGRFTNVFIDGSPWTELTDVNSQGTAVGTYYDDDQLLISHSFTYAADGTIAYLPDALPGGLNFGSGINNRGDVIGLFSADGFATAHGYIYKDGSFLYFDVPGAIITVPWRITDSGTACGWFIDAGGIPHGFVRDRFGNFTQIDVPGAFVTTAYGLNERGDIVGIYVNETGKHGYLLRKGVFTTLDYPGATNTDAFDINNAGVIVGSYDGFSRGFVAYPNP